MNIRRINVKKILLFAVIFVIVGIIAVTTINTYVKKSMSDKILSIDSVTENDYDCIVVLGCGVYSDGTPSSMLSDRLTRAIELYHKGIAPKIIMSGDHGTVGYDEVNIMRKYAIERGVAEEDIFMDHAGFSTYETMYRAKEVFLAKKIIVVTQEYHLYRALYNAVNLGLDASGVGSDYRIYAGQIYRDMREIAARCKDFVTCIIKPKPKFLGDTIPVSGDGRITCD